MSELSYESTKREVATDIGVLRYHEAGDGPPLLLLHGSGPGVTGWRNYRGVLGDFAESLRQHYLDRFSGLISAPRSRSTPCQNIDDR
ncbi:alpha/beta fold hydrolase, partial [Rhodococcus triatomae]